MLNRTFIIRSQVEYSAATQQVILRCILESPATGKRCGFTDAEALLSAVRAELSNMQEQTLPPDQDGEHP